MPQLQLHEFRIPCAGVSRTTIYHFSDCHLAVSDPDATPDEVALADEKTAEFDECRRWFADHCKEPFDPTYTAVDYFGAILDRCRDGDAVLCAGDLVEAPTPATLRYIDRATADLNFMTVLGNHEVADTIPDGYRFSAAKAPVQRLNLPALTVLGFDDGQRIITPAQLDALRQALTEEKPLVILLHIPFAVPENEQLLRGCGEYFRLNHDDCPPENEEFVRLITENSHRIVAVLAGHLHFNHTCPITPTLTQYVSSQGLTGHLNRYVIGE